MQETKAKKILLAGTTGYLGGYILEELVRQNYPVKAIARNPEKIPVPLRENDSVEIVKAEVTRPESLIACCEDIDVVISTIGITRQKDGLTYTDVDYQANVNLLNEALKTGVRKFIYVSVFKGDSFRDLKIMDAKERFVDVLKSSKIAYTIIRPTGFFSDMTDFLNMAKKGKVYLFGDGHFKMNPIHGADLAEVCVKAIETSDTEINIGGPDILTQTEIAGLALKAWSKDIRVIYLPDWIRRLTIRFFRTFTPLKIYGPIEFFLTIMAVDGIAPQYGTHRLEDFYNNQVK
jgi:uncharacterized protein YbjT (DUF2867 family)